MDVIISSKTHTPVYAQKRETGYSESYKKFHGLQIQIVPVPGDQDFYSLTFFYYNWTNRKFDKRLRRRISKYNVLNELRFGLYELLLGKQFVDDHKDEIEKQNYDRIQAVRENELDQARTDRKKKKLEKKKKEDEELKLSLEEEKKKTKLLREEKEKKDKSLINPTEQSPQSAGTATLAPTEDEIEDVKVEDPDEPEKLKDKHETEKKRRKSPKKPSAKVRIMENDSIADAGASPEVPNPDVEETIPTSSSLYAFGNIFDDNLTSDGYLHTSTNLRYMGFGARYIQEQDTAKPRGLRFTVKVGLPIKKDNYEFPVYRSFETEIYKRKLLNHFQLLAGIDWSPLYFVNLPNPGEGLKVFENDIFWFKGGIAYNQEIKGKEIELRALFFKSLLVQSNQKKTIEGTSLAFTTYYQHTKKHGAEISYRKTNMVGNLLIASQSLYFSYVYKFEN